MMSITGTPETAPLRVGFPVSDSVGGLVAAMSICAALAGRARTGKGVFLDVSMLEASLSAMGWAASNYLVSGVAPEPMGDQNATAAPSGTFDAADGPLNIAANRQEQFEVLCRLVDRADLVTDERFADREARKANRAALNHEINAALRRRPALEWEQLLSGAGRPGRPDPDRSAGRASWSSCGVRGFFTDLPFPGDPATDAAGQRQRRPRQRRSAAPGVTAAPAGRAQRRIRRRSTASTRTRWSRRDATRADRSRTWRTGGPRPSPASSPTSSSCAAGPIQDAHRPTRASPASSGCCSAATPPTPGAGTAARGRAGRLGGPRPARAVDRRRPDGGHLRRRAEQRHRQWRQHCWATCTAAPASSAWRCSPRSPGARSTVPTSTRPASVVARLAGPVEVPARVRAPLPPRRPAARPAAGAGRAAAVADGVVDGRLSARRAGGRGGSWPAAARAGADQHRRLHRRRLRRTGLPAAAGARPVRAQPQCRHPRPRLGGDRPGTAQQGTDAAAILPMTPDQHTYIRRSFDDRAWPHPHRGPPIVKEQPCP